MECDPTFIFQFVNRQTRPLFSALVGYVFGGRVRTLKIILYELIERCEIRFLLIMVKKEGVTAVAYLSARCPWQEQCSLISSLNHSEGEDILECFREV